MKCSSPNFNEHEGEFDVRGAAEATAAARVRRVEDHAAARLRRLRPCPGRRPAAVEMGLQEENGDPHAKARTRRHNGSPLHRDALTRIDKVERAIFEITHGSS